jgi:hypothetical protein
LTAFIISDGAAPSKRPQRRGIGFFLLALVVSATPPVCAQEQAVVSGTVRDKAQHLLSAANVLLDGPTRQNAVTDARGKYSIKTVPGVFSVSVSKIGYSSITVDVVTAVSGTVTSVDAELAASSFSSLTEIGRVTVDGRQVINTSTAFHCPTFRQ